MINERYAPRTSFIRRFADYGQCDNIEEREGNSWWTEHTLSFAMRQIAMYEREMGWSFWTWKLEDQLGKHRVVLGNLCRTYVPLRCVKQAE